MIILNIFNLETMYNIGGNVVLFFSVHVVELMDYEFVLQIAEAPCSINQSSLTSLMAALMCSIDL